MSYFCIRGWLSCSAWHSAQSNHFRPKNVARKDVLAKLDNEISYSMEIE